MSKKKNIKICFAASTGGHYEQLLMLKPLMEKYDSFILAEQTLYNAAQQDIKTYFLKQINRKEKNFLPRMICNLFLSFENLFKRTT